MTMPAGTMEKPKKKTAYSMFMVAESKRLRVLHPELSHAELMKMVGDAVRPSN
jgi:hypothetical protein